MDCKQINDPEFLLNMLGSESESVITSVVKCFYTEYREEGLRFCYSRILNEYPVRKERHQELFEDAFSMSVTSFIRYIRRKGFVKERATVKTVFFTFLQRVLKDSVEKVIRQDNHIKGGDPSLIFENNLNIATEDFLTLLDKLERENTIHRLAQKGFLILGERCSNLIRWRKLDKLSNELIAEKMKTIKPSSVPQAVHECLERLRQIIRDLKKETLNHGTYI